MSGRRNLSLAVAVWSVAIATVACAAINEVVTGREIDCGVAPEDVCIRVVDLAERRLGGDVRRNFPEGEFMIAVTHVDCAEVGLPVAARCWDVLFSRDDGSGIGTVVTERADGSLVMD